MSQSKKQLKRALVRDQTVRELVLLLPAFSYMYRQVEDNTSDKESRDYVLAKRITKVMAKRIIYYKPLQQEALDKWNELENTLGKDEEFNVFLLGISLLGVHMEVTRKKVIISMTDDILELQDLCYEFFDKDKINRTAEYAEKIRDKLGF